jgi:hypothetical protein
MYQLRKLQTYTIVEHSQTANLDPEKFREFGYTGNSEAEFLNFISDLYYDDVYNQLDSETRSELSKIKEDVDWTLQYDSTSKFENSWYVIGKDNPEYTRDGEFETYHSTEQDSFLS